MGGSGKWTTRVTFQNAYMANIECLSFGNDLAIQYTVVTRIETRVTKTPGETFVSSVQFSCSVVSDSGTPWPEGRQASVSVTSSRGLLKLISIESVLPSNHHTLVTPFSSAFNQDYERQIF